MFDDILGTLKDTIEKHPVTVDLITNVVVSAVVWYGVRTIMENSNPKKEEKPITTES